MILLTLLLTLIYLAFIRLGLPDNLAGAARPLRNTKFAASLSYAGIVSAIVSLGPLFPVRFRTR